MVLKRLCKGKINNGKSVYVFSFAIRMNIKDSHTIFITGANGFVGQYLVKKLLKEAKHKLILNDRTQANKHVKEEVVYSSVDFSDPDSIEAFFKAYQPDHIIHLAALAKMTDGEENPDKAYEINYIGTNNLIDYAIINEVKNFVFISSDMVRNYQSVVGITKYLSEAEIQAQEKSLTKLITVRLPNISWTPGSVHQIFERLINKINPITITHPDMSRRFISGQEAADTIYYALKNGEDRDIYIINKPPEKITELARQMIAKSGKSIEVSFIGMRPGEKLEEETYSDTEVSDASFNDLALLKENIPEKDGIKIALNLLSNKPGFTIDVSSINN